jgi:hypothetical protein
MNLCSFCQVCLQKPGQQHKHYPTFPELIASAESCHLCELLLESLSGSPREEITKRVRAGSYSKVTLQFSLEDAFVEVITNDRYIKGSVFTVRGPKGQFLGFWIVPKKKNLRVTNSLAIVLAKFVHRAIWSAEEFVSFQQRVPVIDEWVNECLAKHPSCLPPKIDFLPTRLLDVGEGLGSKLRLVESVDIPKKPGNFPKFMALSHCWGKSRPFLVLSSSSIEILSDGIELDQLPRTFKDAARVVQMLGRRYLWIDSLCIKQDSSVDWEKEAAQMDSIYRNAHLTLAAASSTDSNGGCYIDDNLATMIQKFPTHSQMEGWESANCGQMTGRNFSCHHRYIAEDGFCKNLYSQPA